MATVTEIAEALAAVLDANVAGIDSVSTTEYLPAITTQTVACVVVPFDQRSIYTTDILGSVTVRATHWIQIEFWVRHDQGQISTSVQRVRNIAQLAAIALYTNDSTTYELDTAEPMEANVLGEPVQIHDIPYLMASIIVPVWDEITL